MRNNNIKIIKIYCYSYKKKLQVTRNKEYLNSITNEPLWMTTCFLPY